MRKWPFVVAVACIVLAGIVVRVRTSELVSDDAPEVIASPSTPAVAPRQRHDASDAPAAETEGDRAPLPLSPRAERRTILVCKEETADLEPIANAVVTLERQDGSIVTVTTGADGIARLGEDAEQGRSLRVSAAGRVRHGWFHDDRRSWLPERVALETGIEVTGRVVDALDGRPVANAELVATQDYNFGGGGNGPRPPPAFEDRTTTDANGRFRFPGVPRPDSAASVFRGEVAVRANRTGYVATTRKPALLAADDTSDPLVIRLDPDAAIDGVVHDPDGTPIAGAAVRARTSQSSRYFDEPANAVSDEQGRFRIRGLGRGARVTVEAAANGFARSEGQDVVAPAALPVALTLRRLRSFRLRVVGPEGDDVPQCRVAVFVPRCEINIASPEGDSPVGIGPVAPGRIGFMVSAPGMASAFRWFEDSPPDGGSLSMSLDRAAFLEGVVVDDSERPVAKVRVAVGPSTWSSNQASQYLVREAWTDERGAFRVEGLGSGDLVLDVHSGEHTRVVRPVRASESPLRVVLTRKGAIDAAVIAPAGSDVKAYCGVYMPEDGPRFELPPWEGGDGRYHLGGAIRYATLHVEGLPPGRYAITLCTSGFVNARIEAEVLPGRTTRAPDVRLDIGLSIEGQVLDPRGRPLAGVRVNSLGREWDSGVGDTDEAGRFRMGELLPGRHVLGVAKPGMAARLEVDVQSGAAPITLRMQPTRRVRIRVCDDAGSPELDGFLQILNSVSFDFGRQLDACGNTDWELLPGSYDTRYFDAERAPVPTPSIVVEPAPAGDDPGVEFELRLPAKPAPSSPK
jgi:protocatechuate 3,4-dioxygenase beta subunit